MYKYNTLADLLNRTPQAAAVIKGSSAYPKINGMVYFSRTASGVYVAADIHGLPDPTGECESPVFGFHIHSGRACTGNASDAFGDAMSHYNPGTCKHPHHAGDLPPLFGCGGRAVSIFLTDRFTLTEIIGRTVIIHSSPDDFTTQPSGNSGTKIACGVIRALG